MSTEATRRLQRALRAALWVLGVLGLAAAYYLTGRLGLWLAIPPGYATVVWPPSGVALGCLLLLGLRHWPGVWLGSFWVNVWIASDGPVVALTGTSVAVAAGIATGAALQAVAGLLLIQRLVGFPDPLNEDRKIVGFLLLAGPVSCVVNATVGPASLLVGGAVPGAEFLFTWATWWVGDTIGVLIFTPLVLILFGRPGEVWRRRRISVALPLCLTFAVVAVVFSSVRRWESNAQKLEFARVATTIERALHHRLDGYLEILHSIRGFYSSARAVDRAGFRMFVRDCFRRHPGLQALEWAPRVPHAERAAYERAARDDGHREFRIAERSLGALVPAASRAEYFPVYYVEPHEANQRALGFDLASDPIRREALIRARDSDEAAGTVPTTLVQEEADQRGLLIALPIYREGLDPARRDQRHERLEGFALAVLRVGDVAESVLTELSAEGIEVQLLDVTAPGTPQLLYRRGGGTADPVSSGPAGATDFTVADRTWRITISTTLAHLAALRSWESWMVLAGGLVFASLLGTFLLILTGRTARIEGLVIERTAELSRSNADLTREIGERRRIETELREAKVRAEAADRAKSDFLANMSHEIRTPMTAILGYTDLLLGADVPPEERRNYLLTICQNGNHLLTLINDILDLSKIHAGKMTVERIRCSPHQIVQEVAALMVVRAKEKDLEFAVEFDRVPETIQTDPTRLRQILLNLVSNAIKFTAAGGVRLRVSFLDVPAPLLCFEVVDTGVGIIRDKLLKAFQPFDQAGASTTRQFGGTGLGLTISRQLAQLLGGDVVAQSMPGEGSSFMLSIDPGPLDDVKMIHRPAPPVGDGSSHRTPDRARKAARAPAVELSARVLLAEDVPANQRLVSVYLEKAGAVVEIACNGREAVEKVQASGRSGPPFDLVLMDMQMPEMNGYEATAELRRTGHTLPIVALTANAMVEDRQACLDAGCSDYLTKPVDRRALLDAVARGLHPDDATDRETGGGREARVTSEFIDDPEMSDIFEEFLAWLPDQLRALEASGSPLESAAIAKIAHDIKGTAGSVGFTAIMEVAGTVETRARAGVSAEILSRSIRELVAQCERVIRNAEASQRSGGR